MAQAEAPERETRTLAETYADELDASLRRTDSAPSPEEQVVKRGSTEPTNPPEAETTPEADPPEGSTEPPGEGSTEPPAENGETPLTDEQFKAVMQDPLAVQWADDVRRKSRQEADVAIRSERESTEAERLRVEQEEALLSGDANAAQTYTQQARQRIIAGRLESQAAEGIKVGVHGALRASTEVPNWTDEDLAACTDVPSIFSRVATKISADNESKIEARAKEIADARIQEMEDARRRGVPAPSRSSRGQPAGGDNKPGPTASLQEIYSYEETLAAEAGS
jgi:hypothetical protein